MLIWPRNMLQGNPVQEATLVLRLGGRHVTEQLMNQVKVITLDITITIIISIIFLIVITVTSMIKSCSRGIIISPFLMIVNQSHPSTCSPLFWPDQPFNFIMDCQEIPCKLQTSEKKNKNMEGLWNVYHTQLLNGKYSFPDDNFMLWRKKKKTNFTVSSRKEIIREMKVGKGWNLIESERKDVEGCWWGIPCIFLWWI